MSIDTHDRMRREVRLAVVRAAKLREDGRDDEADRLLAARLARIRQGLETAGLVDVDGLIQRWKDEAELAFAHAHLVDSFSWDRLLAHPAMLIEALGSAPPDLPGFTEWLDEMLVHGPRARHHRC